MAFAIEWLARRSTAAANEIQIFFRNKPHFESPPVLFSSLLIIYQFYQSQPRYPTWAVFTPIAAASLNHTPALTALLNSTIMAAGVANPKAGASNRTDTA